MILIIVHDIDYTWGRADIRTSHLATTTARFEQICQAWFLGWKWLAESYCGLQLLQKLLSKFRNSQLFILVLVLSCTLHELPLRSAASLLSKQERLPAAHLLYVNL